jgi:hypothetical protein
MFLILMILAQGINVDVYDKPAPSTNVTAKDKPNDAGGSICVTWTKSVDDGAGRESVTEYLIYRSTDLDGEYDLLGTARRGSEEYIDAATIDGTKYFYVVKSSDGVLQSAPAISKAASSSAQWFHTRRVNMLIALIIISALVLWFIRKAKRGEKLYIRSIAGLEAVDDAVGRATEMGKPIMYIPGIMDMDNIQTIASMVILGRVARRAAEYETSLLVPCCRSIVMSAAQETVKDAYLDAGRLDTYDVDKIRYLTDDQFGYAAGVDGLMIREKPGAIFYMGAFYAESLILAETGHSTGAIQIAGTAMPSQLPFFVTACDYTLIGEELFAASAYLSKEPLLLGSLKGQDWGKALFIIIIIIGVILVTFGYSNIVTWLTTG